MHSSCHWFFNLLWHRKRMYHCANSYECNRWNSGKFNQRKWRCIYFYSIWKFIAHACYLIWPSQLNVVRVGIISIFKIRGQIWDISLLSRSLANTKHLRKRVNLEVGQPVWTHFQYHPAGWVAEPRYEPCLTIPSKISAAQSPRITPEVSWSHVCLV